MQDISTNGLSLLESFEGLRTGAYRDQGGILTIGYGHTGKEVHEGMTITLSEAEDLLRLDVRLAVAAVNHLVRVGLTQNQFDALVCFTYNVGSGALAGSTLLRCVNVPSFAAAACEFPKWNRCAGQVNQGLLKRRLAERDLFLS